jgi:tryptophan synthase alpha chain
MSRINDILAARRSEGGALMPFLTAGYPSLEVTAAAIPALEAAGAHVLEIGFPFSDPIADGPVIAASMHEALGGGVTPASIFAMAKQVRPSTGLGLVAMVSHSIVDRHGPEAFVAAAADAGFDGLIIPDIDLAAARALRPIADAHDVAFNLLVAPTTGIERAREVVELCTGFVYLLARVGITGEQDAAPQIADRVAEIRALTDLPIAVGFGISTPEHVAAVTASADAAIVGSALVRRMGEADDPVAAAAGFVRQLAGGLTAGARSP